MAKVFMSFIELVLHGPNWREELPPFEAPDIKFENLAGSRVFRAGAESEVRLVEPEVVIRRFAVKSGATIAIGSSVAVIESTEILDELSVDEDLRAGKRLKLT